MNVVQVRVCRLAALAAVIMALAGGACASRGGVPRPFPGAATPPATRTPDTEVRPEPSAIASEVIATALALRGTQYRNGGSEPSRGFDCSGLVQWVFAQHGTSLPRETREQYVVGKKVDEDEVRPGDLVFFDADAGDGPQIDHVGIYMGRDTKGHRRFLSSRKRADGPTMGDTGGKSILDGDGLYAGAFRKVRRL